jgi:hypothetical protein
VHQLEFELIKNGKFLNKSILIYIHRAQLLQYSLACYLISYSAARICYFELYHTKRCRLFIVSVITKRLGDHEQQYLNQANQY